MSEARSAETFRTSAEAYDRHVGRYGRNLARAWCAVAGVRPGGSAIDVGCGPGALTSDLGPTLDTIADELVAALRTHL